MSIKELIAAAYNKDATAFESAFQSVMQDKVSAAVQTAFTAEETDEDLDEEVEELDELSGKTLGSYVVKASKDSAASMKKREDAIDAGDRDTARKMGMRARKHEHGSRKAIDKLTGSGFAKVHATEEVEELDELSTSTLKSYRTAAWKDAGKAYKTSDSSRKSDSEREAAFKRGDKRMAGYELATAKTGAKPNKTYQYSGVGSIPNAKVKSTNEEVEE
jgi:dGTP triphosphohydrolase